jgi:hypothetical protein
MVVRPEAPIRAMEAMQNRPEPLVLGASSARKRLFDESMQMTMVPDVVNFSG